MKTTNWWDYDKDPDKVITVLWHNQSNKWWNETCATVLETFGLPGDRFYYRPYLDCMTFQFKTTEDAFLCKILLSDRL
jgi:hypothetical protein